MRCISLFGYISDSKCFSLSIVCVAFTGCIHYKHTCIHYRLCVCGIYVAFVAWKYILGIRDTDVAFLEYIYMVYTVYIYIHRNIRDGMERLFH